MRRGLGHARAPSLGAGRAPSLGAGRAPSPDVAKPAAADVEADVRQRVLSCQGMVKNLAWRIRKKLPPHVDVEELIGEGNRGLVEAARAFEPERGLRFSTYAHYRIRGAIFDCLRKMPWYSDRDFHGSKYEHAASAFLEAREEDEAQVDSDSVDDGLRWLKDVSTGLAVAMSIADGDKLDDGEVYGTGSPLQRLVNRETCERLVQLIEELPDDPGRLLRGMYFEGLTLTAASARIGVSKFWGSRLHAKTLRRLALRLMGTTGPESAE